MSIAYAFCESESEVISIVQAHELHHAGHVGLLFSCCDPRCRAQNPLRRPGWPGIVGVNYTRGIEDPGRVAMHFRRATGDPHVDRCGSSFQETSIERLNNDPRELRTKDLLPSELITRSDPDAQTLGTGAGEHAGVGALAPSFRGRASEDEFIARLRRTTKLYRVVECHRRMTADERVRVPLRIGRRHTNYGTAFERINRIRSERAPTVFHGPARALESDGQTYLEFYKATWQAEAPRIRITGRLTEGRKLGSAYVRYVRAAVGSAGYPLLCYVYLAQAADQGKNPIEPANLDHLVVINRDLG